MKCVRVVFALLFVTLLFSACSGNLAPTGYPSNELQRVYLSFEGQMWIGAGTAKEYPAGFSAVALVASENNRQMPGPELTAAHLKEGAAIYADEARETVYVEDGDSGFVRMVPYDPYAGTPQS